MSCGSTTHHKKDRNREVCYSQVLEEVHDKPLGASRGDQGRVQTEAGTEAVGEVI